MTDSVTTDSSSRLSQFGIYRSIDARTEEFLKLSQKKQIKQGCACAVISTVVTIVIVVVILLIYEYAITVESNLVQRHGELLHDGNTTNDTPVADRLDRSYFGFDQDYFEQMPLLVNAMQESNYVDVGVDMTPPPKVEKKYKPYHRNHKKSFRDMPIRRTSPRPFIFEYRSPTPSPFHKNYNSRSWIESYRNTQRMRNLEQVLGYLEKTINAKFGDLYTYKPSTHISFSGVYVQPGAENKARSTPFPDLTQESSTRAPIVYRGFHKADPLYTYKPESPGDVNLLADAPLKFSPSPSLGVIPMFRPVANTKGCVGIRCGIQSEASKLLNVVSGSAEIKTSNPNLFDKTNTFSVIMNLIPMTTTTPSPLFSNLLTTNIPLNKIYFTTSRPEYQFRRKSAVSMRRRPFSRRKTPKLLPDNKIDQNISYENSRSSEGSDENISAGATNMILHVKVIPKPEATSTTETTPTFTQNIVNITQVEDFHDGSSGIIPINFPSSTTTTTTSTTTTTTTTEEPQTPKVIPFFDPNNAGEEIRAWSTNQPPDILKFSQEDAKIPEQYQRIREIQEGYNYDFGRRISKDNYQEKVRNDHEPPRTLVVKLKNDAELTTTEANIEVEYEEEESESSTVINTYVPQINGHSRHINQNSRNINDWLNEDTEKRKRNLEITSVTGHRTYVPTYVEIRRIRDNMHDNTQDENTE